MTRQSNGCTCLHSAKPTHSVLANSIKFDQQGNSSFVDHCQVPFFGKALKDLVKKLENLDEDDVVPVIEMSDTWISESADEQQTLRRLLTVQQFLLAYPAVYIIEEAAETVFDACNLLSSRRAWIAEVHLEGERSEDDFVLIRCTFPEGLFSPDDMDLSDDKAMLSLAEVGDRLQTVRPGMPLGIVTLLLRLEARVRGQTWGTFSRFAPAHPLRIQKFLERLDAGDMRHVWRDVTVQINGPLPHRLAWQSCGSKRWACTERTWSSSESTSSFNSTASTPLTTPDLSEDIKQGMDSMRFTS
jgi:hypothetical protein